MLQRGVAEQRMDRGQARIAGADAVVAVVFEVVEERADQWRVEVGDRQPRRWGAGTVFSEGQ